MRFYKGGIIVSDYPVLNYRFISAWSIDVSRLISNHYSPAYYGVMSLIEFAK
ncbi:MAG: hypothetical protein ACUVV4_04120 [Candidatus Bathyarchaeia archaeon]